MLTTDEVLAATGVETRQTLHTWRRAGLISEPNKGPSPKGRGLALLWPDDVVAECLHIKRLRHEGQTLAEISKRVRLKGKRKPANDETPGSATADADYFDGGRLIGLAEATRREVKRVATCIRDARAIDRLTADHLERAIKAVDSGKKPCVVVTCRDVAVVDQVDVYLVDRQQLGAIVVLPLAPLIEQWHRKRKVKPQIKHDVDHRVIDLD